MNKQDIKKIGIFRALNLGDLLCIIPAVRALKSAFPTASLTLIGLPWQKTFAKRFHHYFDHFVEFPGWPGLPEQPIMEEKIVEFLNYMRHQHYDLVLQMQGNGVITNSMCMLWGAGIVAGLRKPGEYCPDGKLFPVSGENENEILRFLNLMDALDIPVQGVHLEFPFSKHEVEHFATLRDELKLLNGNYICLHPGARDTRRRWPSKNFALAGDQLAAKGYKIVLTGSEEEKTLLKEVDTQMEYPAINTIEQLGEVSLGDLAALIQHAALLISNDTGVSHIAAALKVPSVIIFSAFSVQQRWAPLNSTLHKAVSAREADPEYVVHCAFDQLEKHPVKESSFFLN